MVARRDTTVLLTGETGAGKEVVARALHCGSGRKGPLVTVNCAGVPAHLLESEFFGSEKGAYTDAGRARAGLFEKADGGTLLLDEIGEMPVELQPKLLRALQEGEVTRLGGGAPRKVNVRVLAATNRDLWQQVQAREFREDLFYRVSVFPIRLPGLRERQDDIPDLVQHFVAMFCERDLVPNKGVEARAMESLRTRPWPGNVRELRNAVELAVIHSQERRLLVLEDFPIPRKQPASAPCIETREQESHTASAVGLSEMVAHFERDLIERALEQAHGNKSLAAERLHVKRTTLVEKIKRYEREGLLATA